jgi:Ca2+-transporting ATPase
MKQAAAIPITANRPAVTGAELPPFHALAPGVVEQTLATDSTMGLSPGEAQRRLAAQGYNELPEKPRAAFLALLAGQFKDFLVLLLIGAAIVSLLLGEWLDATVIILLVVLNAGIGVVQESKADRALASLRKMAAPEARVIRSGRSEQVPARELVQGDVVVLESGSIVPADLRLTESVNLQLQEASLTGESTPVEKHAQSSLPERTPIADQATMAWMGTAVTFGRGRGIVTATARATQIGLIAAMLEEEVDETTPLQRKLTEVGRWLGIAALGVCAVVFLVGVLEGRDILMMFLTSVSLAIAAVPEGLPAIVTVCLALGMREMIRRHALIRRLTAVETLGSATVICTDKTGTLTQNEMTAALLWTDGETLSITGEGWQPVGEVQKDGRAADLRGDGSALLLLQAGMLASDARLEAEPSADSPPGPARYRMVGDPTEGALVVAAAKAGLRRECVDARFPRVAEIPFDSDRKRMSTVHRMPDESAALEDAAAVGLSEPYVMFVKGAPDLLLQRCTSLRTRGTIEPLTGELRGTALQAGAALASQALRVIGVAYRPLPEVPAELSAEGLESNLTFVGLIGMRDPARPEARPAVEVAHRAGIRVVMATGDYAETAAAIGETVGVLGSGGCVITGAQIDALDEPGLASALETATVFARVSPQHKVRIVDALRRQGHVVGMTGDGVNDAPALKRADIGIAMGISGTDVTRETADMVLTDDNFASIVSAVEQGRIIFSNIRKFVYFLLTCNVGEIGTIFFGTLFGWPVPLTAIQLLWMNLLTDGAPALALGMEKKEPGIMDRPPRPASQPIIDRAMAVGLVVQGVVITVVTLLAFWAGLTRFGSLEAARTMAFVTLSGCQVLRAYTNRSDRASVFTLGVFSNRWMQYAALSSTALVLAVVYVPGLNTVFNAAPLSAAQWLLLAPLLVLPAAVDELAKFVMRVWDRAARKRA